tara:strand:+ start:156 stop:341 length:186 start_codon:yes stop_codon:yes gene_type:complete
MSPQEILEDRVEQLETHWDFVRGWLKTMCCKDNTVSTKYTIPVYAKVLKLMDDLEPRGEEE